MITITTRQLWIAAASVFIVALVVLAYIAGRQDDNTIHTAASSPSDFPSVEEVIDAQIAQRRTEIIVEVCPGWRIYGGTPSEVLIRDAFIRGAGQSVGPYTSEQLWLVFRDRLNTLCQTVV